MDSVADKGAGTAPPVSKEDLRKEVGEKVAKEHIEKFTNEDGTFDVEGAAKAYFLKDEKVHYVNKEAKERRELNEALQKEIDEKLDKIKVAEEATLLEEKKYQELLTKKDEEILGLKEIEKQKKELEVFKDQVVRSQDAEIELKLAALGKTEKEIYDTAEGLGNIQKLALLNKLSTTQINKQANGNSQQSGGRASESGEMSIEELHALKKKNPALYRAKLEENSLTKQK